ncbi:MAG: hypothetical protein JNL14_10725 [Devosia sp.]|uniref:hypothetical protein n=1 Tax=Devosia sp. TaxID=1871048 RepID=UPI001A5332C6|nr:hypothetical protein [Devosia sp.]MBL8598201.1 hypothetical protein [Devosia sp.]
MMFRSLGAVAALLMTTSLAQAAFDPNAVATQLQSEGYTRIEIKIGQNIAKVEAIKGGTKIEVTYDIASGEVIETETEAVDGDDDTRPGVVVREDRDDDDDNDDRDDDDDQDDDDDDQDDDRDDDNDDDDNDDDDDDDDGDD